MTKKNTEIENQKPILSVQDLKVHFFMDEGTVKAVEGASFDVFPGRTLGIVGESGCGKSVATRSLLRLVDSPGKIVDGEIIYRGNTNKDEINITSLKTSGSEIKSIRDGKINISEGYVQIRKNGAWLHNVHIAPYQPAGINGQHKPLRVRKLLLNKKEQKKILLAMSKENLTIIPTSVYLKTRLAKVEIALAKGKKNVDKRNTIKKRESDRDINRSLKNRQ